MACVLGVDIGGTSIKVGVLNEKGDLLGSSKITTGKIQTKPDFDRVCHGLADAVRTAGFTPEQVDAVGLDIPGPVDEAGRVGMLPNIEMDPEGLCAALNETFANAVLAFVNDANAATLGELWKGSAQGASSLVMLTLGTGVGGGVVVGGRLVSGAFGAGGEVGHITVCEDEERVCGCGRRGCLEQYASAKGIVWLYRHECELCEQEPVAIEHDTDTLSVFNAAKAGDECALAAIDIMAERLGYALAQISCVVDPAVYLIGGGVSGGYDLFSAKLGSSFRQHCLGASAGALILPCGLGNDAGMYGVAYAALQKAGLA